MATNVGDRHNEVDSSLSPMTISATALYEHTSASQRPFTGELPVLDIIVRTSGGIQISVHSGVLASASPVLENIIHRQTQKLWTSENVIFILGVPCEAVAVFIEFLYSSSPTEEQMEKFGIHLLALSHVYLIPQLKQVCSKELGRSLTVENVVDILQLARMCDTPDLYLKCMKLVYSDFTVVEETEGWKFLQYHDPWLELEILHFIDEIEQRKRKTAKQRKEESLFMELSVAMECLEHIFKEGCTNIRPHDMEIVTEKTKPCSNFGTCRGLQLLICHFASCKNRVNGGCSRCKRMWQLLRLHSSICDVPDSCKIPLCRKLKMETLQVRKKKHAQRWKLLAMKVATTKVMSSLSQVKMKRANDIAVTVSRDSDTVHGCPCSSFHHMV